MSLPTINTVDPIALRCLMTETVFDVGESAPLHVPEQAAPFLFFGGNRRNYLFLAHDEQHQWMPQAAMDAFVKTLAALKLTEDDVALLNLAGLAPSPSVEQLIAFFEPTAVVNLGTPFAWPAQDGIHILHTHAFTEMLVDAEKKRAFWLAVKQLLI